jgi:radical SAM superfamily enzyme YgiQ (UPF0313 family)
MEKGTKMRTRIIHLVNPKTDSLTTRPLYMNRALYSPLAGLLAVAAAVPRDRYEVILTDENIEAIDFDLKADLVGISAMTSYVNRGYQIADAFRARGVPVVMGGVHPSFMPQESLKHCDAVVIGEVESVIDKLLDDLEHGEMRGTYKSDTLHSMVGLPMPRYDLLKKNRYVCLRGPSHQRQWQVFGAELIQQLLEGFFSCDAGHRHGLKIDRRLLYRACSSGAINLPPPRFRRRCPVLYDN